MTPEELATREGISRRKMLKRIGAGAAIAWTAPVLTSIKTPAFAASCGPPSPCPPENCGCSPCAGAIPCNGSSSCNCWLKGDGSYCVCAAFVQFCGDCGSCPSGCDNECAGGCACVQTCCGFTCAPTPCPPPSCVGRKSGSGPRTTK